METYIEALNTYLSEQVPGHRCFNAESLLHMLCCCHIQRRGPDSKRVGELFREAEEILCRLPQDENDQLFSLVCDLCSTYQRESFCEGVRVGFRLYQELTGAQRKT